MSDKVKGDDEGLLTDRKIYQKFSFLHNLCLEEWTKNGGSEMFNDLRGIAKAQRDLTASIKEVEVVFWVEAFGKFRSELRNILGKHGVFSNLGWSDNEVLGAVDDLLSKKQALKEKEVDHERV